MLRGRESLIRLVGKRRRFLPNRVSLLSTPLQSSSELGREEDGTARTESVGGSSYGGKMEDAGEKGASEVSASDWVICPVCGSKVRGDDHIVNAHLDACLSRGTKRKLTQRTLLQLNFCSKSEVRTPVNESEQLDSYDSLVQNGVHGLIKSDAVAGDGKIQCSSYTNVESVLHLDIADSSRDVESEKSFPSSGPKYQQNFCLLIAEALRSNLHLFTVDERIFLESFTSLSDDSQRLFVRLYTRKGPWFRMSNISYPEVVDSHQAVNGLSASGYMCSLHTDEQIENYMKEILNVLVVSELREISIMFKKKGNYGARKHDLIGNLLSLYEDGLCPLLPRVVIEKTGTCVRISSKAETLIWRVERLFFLNGEQDLSAFLLVDLGIVKYPTYNCIVTNPIFSDRSDLLAYEEAIEVAQVMDQSLDENNNEVVLKCIKIADSSISGSIGKSAQSLTDELEETSPCFTASWVYSKVILLGVSYLERERRYGDAIKLLKHLLQRFTCDGRRGYWTLRLSVDLEHMGCLDDSLSVAENGLLDSWVRAGSRLALQKRVLRLGKPPRRWKTPSFSESIKRKIIEVHIQGRPLNCEIGTKNRFYGEDGDQCGVEQLALQYYAGEGGEWQGTHTENGIWLTIFGLLMWDILFADVPNVFHTRFQTAPLDLGTGNFYAIRKTIVESQLQKIHEGMGEEMIITSWQTHEGTSCRGVNWVNHSLSELRAAVTCIGGPCLASLCRHLAQDYRSWSSGMPDLLLWRFHGEYKGEAKLVEVKGPRDRLSEQQQAWLLLLMDCGFSVEVCKVSPKPFSS